MQGQEFDSSTFHHFFLSGVLRVLRGRGGAKNNNAFRPTTAYIYSYMRKRSERFFFPCCCYEFFFFEVSFSIVQYYNTTTTSYGGTYYYYFHPSILSKYTLVFTLLYLSRVVLFDVPVAQKRRHSERKVGWIFFYVKLEIFLQTFRLFLPGRVVFLQRNRTLRLVVVKQ